MKAVSAEILDEITDRLARELRPEQIYLYGSHAWGEPHNDSDIDLLVVLSDSPMSAARRAQQAYRCLRGLAAPTDILVKTRNEVDRFKDVYASLECQVLERGKVLYDRGETGHGQGLAY